MKNATIMIFFLFIFVAIIFLAHYFFYDFLVRFFSVKNIIFKRTIIFFLVLLPVLFIASMASMHYYSSIFTRGIYFVAGLWHGILTNFVIVIFASWFVIGILKIFKINPSPSTFLIVGIISVVMALAISVYGVFNVFNIKVKEITFEAKNLPVYWQGKKAIQITDVHLGSILRGGYMTKIIKEIDKIEPDIIFITGDLFDSVDGDAEVFQKALQNLHAKEGIFFVTGNHETYFGLSKMEKILNETEIVRLDDVVSEIHGLQVIGISYPDRMNRINVVDKIKEIPEFNPEKTNVLLYHEPANIDKIKETGIDLMLSGHTHEGQMWPFHYITNTIFKGYDYGFFKEGDFSLNVSSGAGVWGPTMRTSGHNEIVVINFK